MTVGRFDGVLGLRSVFSCLILTRIREKTMITDAKIDASKLVSMGNI